MPAPRSNFNPRPPRRGRQAISFHDLRLGRISIHAPARGATPRSRLCGCSRWYFNPRPPRGGRQPDYTLVLPADEISTHAPREGGDVGDGVDVRATHISSHAPARGATQHGRSDTGTYDFNPRPREGGDMDVTPTSANWRISIHAPARGATTTLKGAPEGSYISIHAPARGATLYMYAPAMEMVISIHAPARGAMKAEIGAQTLYVISIHAPARGGDASGRWGRADPRHFNPRPREGGDYGHMTVCPRRTLFQSTPPRGGRHRPAVSFRDKLIISIHAPARGATPTKIPRAAEALFQSTPPRGGRPGWAAQ